MIPVEVKPVNTTIKRCRLTLMIPVEVKPVNTTIQRRSYT